MFGRGQNNLQHYDYIIVGSGTAGSLLAARLSADEDCRVLVLEAGGGDHNPWLKLPVGYYKAIYNSKVSHLYRSVEDPGINGRQMDCPRGRVVGGSSSINGLIFIRGQREDFDDWAKMGAHGWGYEDVLPYFRNFERYSGADSQYRGSFGELNISDLRNKNFACDQWLQAASEYGIPNNTDFNGGDSLGAGKYQLTIKGRYRASAATAFLKPSLKNPNLDLLTRATVAKINFEGKRAKSVSVLRQGEMLNIEAGKEIILCAGSVQTPQLLELSGIGNSEHLAKLGIETIHHSPEVGENLQDHLQMRTIVQLREKGLSLNDQVRNPLKLAKMGMDWLFNASGPLTVGAGQVGAAVCSKYADGNRPDLQLFVMPLSVDKPGKPLHNYSGFTTSYWICHPESRGSIHVTSDDPLADPSINCRYLSAQRDRDLMVEGLRIVRDIYHQPSFRDMWDKEIIPGASVTSKNDVLSEVGKCASTVYHLTGTCRMGSDEGAVVDPQLRVNGVDGLRIVDASVMPKITSANTNAPTYMIAEHAAAIIKNDSASTFPQAVKKAS